GRGGVERRGEAGELELGPAQVRLAREGGGAVRPLGVGSGLVVGGIAERRPGGHLLRREVKLHEGTIVGSGPVKVWVGERMWEEDEARMSPFDHAIITGDGVFETMKVEGGRCFALGRHLNRLARSAAGLRLEVPEVDLLRRAVGE